MKGLVPIIKMHSGCDYHRLMLPLTHMGMNIEEQFKDKTLKDMIEEAKIIIYNRTPIIQIEQLVELRKHYGFKIVVDLDDYWELYPHHILYNGWYANKTNIEIQKNLKEADHVIVTTSLLADKVRAINKNVHVIPNALPYDQGQFNVEKEEGRTGGVRFLYACGVTHRTDMLCLKNPFQKTLSHPAFYKTEFILAGVDQRNAESKETWARMENSFSLTGKLRNFSTRGTLPLDSYMDHYKHCDVTLVPLEDNNFNKYKSNLKILESAAKYNPVIASDLSPYKEFPNRDLVMFAHNTSSWYEHLKRCATDSSFVKEAGQALGEYCREVYHLDKINEYRKQLFNYLTSIF